MLTVVWLDSASARVFEFSNDEMKRDTVKPSVADHHTQGHDSKHSKTEKALFQELSRRIGRAEKVLLLGPGVAKNHFLHYLEDHNKKLAENVVGVETVDHPSDNQIAQYTYKYFHLKTPFEATNS